MNSFLIFISLTIFSFAGYIVWPSRYNVLTHGFVASGFISIIVPTLILNVPDRYPEPIVDLYSRILIVGIASFIPALIAGFILGRRVHTNFSFDVMKGVDYETRVIKITKIFMIAGIVGLILSYRNGVRPGFCSRTYCCQTF